MSSKSSNPSSDKKRFELSDELLDVLGDEDFMALVEGAGGTRLFVPAGNKRSATWGRSRDTSLSETGRQALSRNFAGVTINVPLAREWRAVRYAEQGMSNASIAVKLGIVEASVDKIFRRLGGRPKPKEQAA